MTITGLVIAAGSSRRLGTPKQLLPFHDTTLLGATLAMARACRFDQLVVTLGHAADQVRAGVELDGTTVVHSVTHAEGCSSSIRAALEVVDDDVDGVVLLLGDQPGVDPEHVRAVIDATASDVLGVCRYDDGLGHPLWLGRASFPELAQLRGDKAVWKLLASADHDVVEVAVPGSVPIDVDTVQDYERLLGTGSNRGR